MANLILTNNSSQVECTLSQHYCRLTGSFAGPLTASSAANSGFLIQNGNKQSGLFVGNSCFVFGRNYLDFSQYSENVILKIPNSPYNFYVSGGATNQILSFNSAGTLSIGSTGDTTYCGLQVINSSPSIILKDSDSVTQNQSIAFRDSSNTFFTCFWNNPNIAINNINRTGTQISYNKLFILNDFGSSVSTVFSGSYLTLGSGNCSNSNYNLSIGGSGFFTSGILTKNIEANTGYFKGLDLFLSGSGNCTNFNICNSLNSGSGNINFYNSSGGLYNQIVSKQYPANGSSDLDFYTTPIGNYNSTDRKQLSLRISGDKSARFYGTVCAETGRYNYEIRSVGIENSGCRTYLAPGGDGFHYFGNNASNLAYGISIDSNSRILNHVWLTSGRASMCLDFGQNLTVTGCLFSSGINSNSSLIVNNPNATDSCIRSRCITFCANGTNQNIINCGNFINYGSRAIFSGICSTGRQDNFISGCLCVQDNIYTNSICLTAEGGVCGPSGCFTTCVQSQVICSNSCVRANSICSNGTTFLNCFSNSIAVNGFISGLNTTKAWGHAELIDGVCLTPSFAGYNFQCLKIISNTANTSNFIYSINLCTGVRYPFSLQMSAIPKGTFGWNSSLTSSSTAVSFAAVTPNFIVPICSGVTIATTTGAYSVGSTYCELYFIILNCKGLGTPFSDLTKANHDVNVMFTISSTQ